MRSHATSDGAEHIVGKPILSPVKLIALQTGISGQSSLFCVVEVEQLI